MKKSLLNLTVLFFFCKVQWIADMLVIIALIKNELIVSEYPSWLCVYIFTQPICQRQDITQDQFLNRIKLVWILNFPKLLAGRTDWFMPFSRVLVPRATHSFVFPMMITITQNTPLMCVYFNQVHWKVFM